MNTRTGLLLVPLLLAAAPAGAQRFPALGGIDVRATGVENPADPNEPSPGASADLDLGSFVAPVLRPFVGGTWFRTGAPEGSGNGDIEAVGGRAGLRLDVLGASVIAPYVFGAVTGLQVDAEVDDEAAAELLSGFNTGATAGGGVVYSPGGSRRIGITAEGSYTWINNLNHWSAGVGLRYRPFGRGTYGRPSTVATRVTLQTSPVVQVVEAPRGPGYAASDSSTAAQLQALRVEVARLAARDAAATAGLPAATDRREGDAAEAALRSAEAESRRLAAALAEAQARGDSLARLADRDRAADAESRTGAALLELAHIASGNTSYRETERGIVITLGDGLFPTARAELAPAARAEVARVGFVLGHFRESMIRVEGHTDDAGTESANQALSERRAAAVRAALIAEGILPERVIAVGYGESRPAASNLTAQGRAANRRVEVVITGEPVQD